MGEFWTSCDLGDRDPVRASRGRAFFVIAARRLLIAALLALGVAGAAAAAEKKIQKVTYEAQVEKNGKRSEVAVDALGKRVKP